MTWLLLALLWVGGGANLSAEEAVDERSQTMRVALETSLGRIVVELDEAKAPATVENFLQYVDDRFYDGTLFHRVIPGFMIQTGGYTPDLVEKPTRPPIVNEASRTEGNQEGTLAMARKGDPDSATAQFFINLADNQRLDYPAYGGGYAVFGRVVEGQEVVDAIAARPTQRVGPHEAVPREPILLERVTRLAGE